MARGGPDGFPIVDVKAVCTGGKHHAVDSSEMSFKMAGSLALREAVDPRSASTCSSRSATIRVQVPAVHHGDVLGDLNSRRAQVLGTDTDDIRA
jgi:elongation factor G